MVPMSTPATIRSALERALRAAMKAKDTVAVSALRSALAAIANAEAVPLPAAPESEAVLAASRHVAGGVPGAGATDAERRRLTEEDMARVVRDEICERQAAAGQYRAAGHADRAERLLREASAIQAALE
jgi:hypothetical protein